MLIHVLIVKDVEAEAELMAAALRQAGFAPEWRRAATEAEYVNHLEPGLDVILGDYRLPSFSAERALHILKERELDVPFIVVSGTIREDAAVALMKQGAIDYLFKDRLAHLGSAVAQALEHKRLRAATRAAEAALRDSEERYRLITETIRDAIFMIDLEGRLIFGNRSGEDLTGYSLAEFRGLPIASLLSLEAARESAARLAAVRAGEDVSPWFETEITRKDGTRVWVEAQVATVLRDGAPVGRIGVVRDITERRRSEESLRLLESAVRHAGESIIITTAELDLPGPQILFVNPAFVKITGYTAEEVIGRTPRILQGPLSDRAALDRLRAELSAGQESYGETINYRKDRTPFPVAWHITPVRDEQGRVGHFVGIQRDLTEEKRAEQQLAAQREALYQSEKLGAMGQLLAGVAHELNNPLSVVIGHATLLAGTAPPEVAERAAKIQSAAERCGRIVKNFLALARQRPTRREPVDLKRVVREAVELLAYPLRVDTVEVTQRLAAELPALSADPDELHQVVVNLISNAQQAMRESASPRKLTITTRRAGDRAVLEVADTGPGVPAEIRSKIFEPFFTTKPPGQGTGLGLSLCQSIVERHRGTLSVESAPGAGATFRVEIPVGSPAEEANRTAVGPASPPARPYRILVVDDELDVAELLKEMLAADGHEVETATNGVHALEKIRAQSYDLVFCDMRMPELDGPSLYRQVAQSRPEQVKRWIFLTGDVLSPETTAFLESIRTPTLTKSFGPDDLRRVVAQVAAGP